MDRRCAAGALLALAACIATTAAAPTASNQTALDLYEGPSEGCYYNFQHYGEGDRIMTNEPCLNCTCHNRMLMCYLRVCPFTKPIGQDCSVEKRADQCCPIVTCPDVPVDLLTSTSTTSPSEYGETGLGKLDRYGCSINGKYFPEGAKVPPSPNKPCEHCYCIRNMTTCVMQECTLHVDGCTPIYRKDVCCPVRYSCDHPEDEIPLLEDMTTTVRPTPGFLLTTTTLAPVTQMTQDCVHDDKIFADGALIKTEKACEHCYCMKGDIVCVVQECGTPMENEGKNCTSMIPREGQCCPDTYICEGDELTTETGPDVATVSSFGDITTTLSPPRRVSVEGSGYRSETDEPSTETPIFELDVEGSGEDQSPFKPTDASDIHIQESETSPPLTVTEQGEIKEQYSPSTTEASESDERIGEKATTEADKGENTVPSGGADEDSSEPSVQDKTSPRTETTTTKFEVATELSAEAKTTAVPEDRFATKKKTTLSEEATTEPAFVSKSTTDDHETSQDSSITSDGEIGETTLPSRRKDDGEITPLESTTPHLDESTTKASVPIAPEPIVTESTTSSIIEQETQTAISPLTDTDNEVKVPITEPNLDITTSSHVTEAHTQPATTVQPEIVSEFTTPGKTDVSGTTSANPIENEIDEEPLPTLPPGRIPGEGDCLLDGVTYSHESIVPSTSNCHTSCKCISSIVKCEQIVCSPPPDYMDNCQPMYDSPESCCPTYVCDHPKETVPPQSHSQMAGTESPIPTPSIECAGDQCEIAKDKEDTKPSVSCASEGCTDDTSKQPGECGSQGCDEVGRKPEDDSAAKPSEECVGDSCLSSPEQCASGKCETAIPKDQTCNNENGCEYPVVQTCQGDNCAIQPDVTAPKEDSTPEKSPDCNGDSCVSELPQQPIPQEAQGCKDGNDCAIHPNVTTSNDDSAPCDSSEGCKSSQIPAKSPDCNGNSCISELPPHTIPQGEQDCKNGEDCVHSSETPAGGECSEEECKTQFIPEVSKPSSGDCSGTECIQQQDHDPQTTAIPEIATESSLGVTEEPQKSESMEPVSDLPKTTDVEKESAVTKAPLPNIAEESSTTTQHVETDADKDRDTQEIGTKSPADGTQTPDGQNQESITESALEKETTVAPLLDVTEKKYLRPEVTPEITDVPTPKIPDLSGETTTIHPSSTSSDMSESTQPTDYSPSVVTEDTKYKDTPDTTTTESYLPHVPFKSSEASPETTESQELQTRAPDGFDGDGHKETQETTESQEMITQASDNLDRDGHDKPTKEPEYVQDTEDKVPESTERYTSAPEKITDKAVDTTQEHELQEAITTPKSYNIQTTIPVHLDTDTPETHTSSTRDEEPGISVSISTTEKSVTSKPDDTETVTDEIILPGTKDEAETTAPEIVDQATLKPEVPKDHESETQSPGMDDTSVKDSITTALAHDTTDEPESQTMTPKSSSQDSDLTPPPIVVEVGTEIPMVKDHEHEDDATTISPELAVTTDSASKEPESPESEQLPESTAKPGEAPYEKPLSGIERMPSVGDEGRPSTTTEKSYGDLKTTPSAIAEDELPTKQSVPVSDVTAIPETETRTDSSTTSVPTVSGAISSEPSVTEGSSVSQEERTDSPLITSIASEDIETKSPITVTESFLKPTSEGIGITTPNQEQMNEDTTELPELVVHEHPTEPSLVEKEPEQPVTEDATSNLPDEKPLETTSQKETFDEPTTQDAATIALDSHITEPQKDFTAVTEEYFVTKSPEISQPEITEAHKDEESPATEFEKEVTNVPDSQASTLKPEIIVTDAQKEATESPPVTSAPKVTEAEISTKDTELPPVVTDPEVFVTEHHKDTTDIPVSHDMVTIPSDIDTKPDKESTDLPVDSELDPYKKTSATQESITTVSDISSTESHKEATETPEQQHTVTKVPDIYKDESEKESANEPKPQDAVTIVPETSVTEPQDEASKVPEVIDVAVKVPEPPETDTKKDTTEITASQDLTTTGPTESITETAPIEVAYVPVAQDKVTSVPDTSIIESEKDVTEAPTYDGSSSYVPDVHATETQKEVTTAPATEDTATESQKDTPEPELQEPATSAPLVPETEPKKETTKHPASQEVLATVSEMSQTEPKTETTKMPEIQVMTEVPEISHDTKAPESTATDAAKEVTSDPGTQHVTTEAQKEVTDSQKEVTEQPEKSATEPEQNFPTQTPASQNTVADTLEDSHKETTAAATISPEMFATESDKEKTEAPEQELTTTAPEFGHTEAQPGKSSVTDETSTDVPSKITTKFDHQSEPQEFITSTELSKIESDTSVPTVSVLPVDQVTKVEGPLPTQSPAVTETDKSTTGQADADVKKPEGPEVPEIYPETPSVEPTVTDAPISPESVDPATKAPELIDLESSATVTPESPVTEKKDHTIVEEYVTQSPHTSEPQDKTTREPEQTSESKGETTPYSILLEEHTHKTVSPEEEITTSPSDVPSKEYELPTSEAPISITEPAPSTETDKSPQEDVSDKDHYIPELKPTAVTEKSTEPLPVSETIITTLSLPESPETEKPQYVESNEISTSAPTIGEEATEKDKPLIPSDVPEAEKEVVVATEKPQETSEDEPILTTKATTIKTEEEATTPAVLIDKFDKPDEEPKPTPESEKPRPDAEDVPKPGSNEVQPTEEAVQPEEDGPFPPSGTSGYGQEPDYGEEDSFGPGTCRYGGKVYVSAQQIPRDDPCDFCFCFRSDIICLQQSCPPPIHGCHEEPIQGFCCPRYECPVSMATSLNVTTTTTTTTTTLPPHFLPHAYKGAAQRRGCQIKGHTYKVGEVVRASSGPCLHCTCGGDGQMKCDPKVCTPEPMLRQMIAAAVSAKRRR